MADILEQIFKLGADMGGLEKMIQGMGAASQATGHTEDSVDAFTKKTRFMTDAITGAASELMKLKHANELDALSAEQAARAQDRAAKTADRMANGPLMAARAAERLALEEAKATTEAARLERELVKAEQASTSFLEKVSQFALGGWLANGLTSIGHELASFPGKILAAAAGAEHMDRALELTFGGAKGRQLADYAGRISNLTFADDDQIKGWLLDMGKAGVAFGDLDKNMAVAATMAAKSKDPIAAMSMTIDALTEATRRGSISNRQLRPLGIGPEQLKTLDQFKGLSTKQLNKELEQGKIDLVDLRKLLEGNNKLLGTTGVSAAGQMGIALKNLRNTPEQLFQEFAKTDAFGALAAKFSDLAHNFGPDGPSGKKIVDFMGKLGTQAVVTFNSIDWNKWGDRILDFLRALPAALERVAHAARIVGDIVGFGAKIAKPVVNAAVAAGTPIVHGLSSADSAVSSFMHGGSLAGKILRDYTPLGYFDTGMDVAAGLQKGIEAGAPGAAEAAAAMAGGAHAAAKDALDSHSPSRLAMTLGGDYAEGWGIGLDDGLTRVRSKMAAESFAAPPARPSGGGQADGEGGVTVQLVINNNVHASGDAQQIASATMEAAKDLLPSAVAALFSRWRQQAGA